MLRSFLLLPKQTLKVWNVVSARDYAAQTVWWFCAVAHLGGNIVSVSDVFSVLVKASM